MHEYSIIDALLREIDAAARSRGAVAVHRIELAIGDLSGVERDLLALAFDAFRENTICATADLAIRQVAARWECPRCAIAPDDGGYLRCPTCGGPARLADGGEIILERLEMEVPDVS